MAREFNLRRLLAGKPQTDKRVLWIADYVDFGLRI